MSVTGRAEAYDRHTGRYGPALSAASVRFVGIEPGMRVLDVGCGPGAPTRRLAHIVGADRVPAVDPSEAYADACRHRVPGASVRVGSAQALPFDDGGFDAVLVQPGDPGARRRAGGRARDASRHRGERRGRSMRVGLPRRDAAARRVLGGGRGPGPDGARDAGDDSVNPGVVPV